MRLSTRINQLERKFEKIRYKFQYSSIVLEDKDGTRWFHNIEGERIKACDADPSLLPRQCVILPWQMRPYEDVTI